jgi:hypothetical protein
MVQSQGNARGLKLMEKTRLDQSQIRMMLYQRFGPMVLGNKMLEKRLLLFSSRERYSERNIGLEEFL